MSEYLELLEELDFFDLALFYELELDDFFDFDLDLLRLGFFLKNAVFLGP
jgi:hypothetical protein